MPPTFLRKRERHFVRALAFRPFVVWSCRKENLLGQRGEQEKRREKNRQQKFFLPFSSLSLPILRRPEWKKHNLLQFEYHRYSFGVVDLLYWASHFWVSTQTCSKSNFSFFFSANPQSKQPPTSKCKKRLVVSSTYISGHNSSRTDLGKKAVETNRWHLFV